MQFFVKFNFHKNSENTSFKPFLIFFSSGHANKIQRRQPLIAHSIARIPSLSPFGRRRRRYDGRRWKLRRSLYAALILHLYRPHQWPAGHFVVEKLLHTVKLDGQNGSPVAYFTQRVSLLFSAHWFRHRHCFSPKRRPLLLERQFRRQVTPLEYPRQKSGALERAGRNYETDYGRQFLPEWQICGSWVLWWTLFVLQHGSAEVSHADSCAID